MNHSRASELVVSACLILIPAAVACGSDDSGGGGGSGGGATGGSSSGGTGGSAGTGTGGSAGTGTGGSAGTGTGGSAGTGGSGGGVTDGGGGDAAACQPTGGLPAPAAGKAVLEATFSDAAGGYNGSTAPFVGVEVLGHADGAGQARFGTYNKTPTATDDTLRFLEIAVLALPSACQSFTTTSGPSVTPYIRYSEGANLARQWWCGGTVMVDTVNGKSYTFHFEAMCAKSPVLSAIGTVKIAGKGAGTFN